MEGLIELTCDQCGMTIGYVVPWDLQGSQFFCISCANEDK